MEKVALITGGSRGIGLGIARQLALDGVDLAINGVRPEEAVTGILEELRSYGSRVIYCQGDISDKANRQAMMDQVSQQLGKLNFLVNNAGVAPKERKDILKASEESFEYVLKTNLQGPYFLSQLAANWLIEQKRSDPEFWGGIVNVSSISATVASVNRGEYCVAKAGLSMTTQLFATRLGEYDLPVYEVRPGIIATDMTSGVKEKYDRLIDQGLTVQKRWGYPEDIGKTVAALVRGDLPYSTGSVIMIDGGLTINRL
ncbi:MAG: 3-ketoacyl-ACP reductase [Candidatus Cyclobacteriaceae bacterium M3_2C_046]